MDKLNDPTVETQPTAPGSALHLLFWVTSSLKVDLLRLSGCSEYFRALSQSGMRETSESLVQLDHVSSSVFYRFLEFSFHSRFIVPVKELDAHIQVWGRHVSRSGDHCDSSTSVCSSDPGAQQLSFGRRLPPRVPVSPGG